MTAIAGNRVDLFHTASAAHLLTTSFVAGDEFETGEETAQTLEVVLGGLAMTSCLLQLEESNDGGGVGGTWAIIADLPAAGVLDGATANHTYPVILDPRKKYRWSAKRVGGDATSTAYIVGTTRDAKGVSPRLANRDPVDPAYDETNAANNVAVINPLNKFYSGAPVYEAVDIADDTYYIDVDHDGVRGASVAFVIAGTVTLTYEISNVDDGTAPASIPAADWSDQTTAIWGAANYTATGHAYDDNNRLGKTRFGRWKMITAGGAAGDNCKITMRGID